MKMTLTTRTITDLLKLTSFDERYEYLKLVGTVGEATFGYDRYLNQLLYQSRRWLKIRDEVIIRDNGCDLGVDGYLIRGRIIVHHINPINVDDVMNERSSIYNPEYLVCVSHNTHLAIHFGDKSLLPVIPVERYPGDTCPWR